MELMRFKARGKKEKKDRIGRRQARIRFDKKTFAGGLKNPGMKEWAFRSKRRYSSDR